MNFRSLLVLFFATTFLRGADAPPSPRQAAPAFVDVVTFNVESDGEKRTLSVLSAPGLVRIDVPTDRMSILYDPLTEHYTGLEHSNYTWWEFTWPEVRDAVEGSARYASRLRDIGPELLEENNEGSSPATNAPTVNTNAPVTDSGVAATDSTAPTASTSAGGDDSGYVWHPTTDRKRIAGFDCVHWVGETVGGEQIDAWCAAGLQAPVEHAMVVLRAVNEPMALVPVRNLMPTLAFVAWDAMTKGGVTPVLMTWGSDQDVNRIALVNVRQREGKLSYFEVPKLYVKTTLVTMDGIANQKPADMHRIQTPMPQAHVPTVGLPAP
jgi:hypothetical protein